jgi:hypothetical protein
MCVYMERDDEMRYRASSRFLFFKNRASGEGRGGGSKRCLWHKQH